MKKTTIISFSLIILLVAAIAILAGQLKKVTEDRNVQRKNVASLFESVENYKVRDSLNAATIGDLQLSLSQYKQYRAEDAELIRSLKVDNKRLRGVMTAQTESYYQHTALLRDSVKMLARSRNDSTQVPVIVKTANFADKWHSLKIVIEGDSLNYRLKTKESLLITNHIIPKKFLFFKFGCKEVRTDVVSKNPYVIISDVESITIR